MDAWNSMNGMITVELTCADPSLALRELEKTDISLMNIRYQDELTVTFCVGRCDWQPLHKISCSRGHHLRITGRSGIYWSGKQLLKRPVLLIGLTLIVALTLFVQTRVLFFRVEGNHSVPTRHILEKAAQCGITFGISGRSVRSEKVKNTLLEAMPELQWAGINTRGCVVTITVRERSTHENPGKDNAVSSIVASRDGIVQEITVTGGSAACRTGQAVKAGQVLISAYTDCGLTIRACRAEGEILGMTRHDLEVISGHEYLQRGQERGTRRKKALIIGKKRINFYKGSGISDSRCAKMYLEKYVTLPGGFTLPIIIVTEITIDTECLPTAIPVNEEALSDFAERYLRGTMRSGRILSSRVSMEDGSTLKGTYQCLEMIGVRKQEEIIKPNE